MHDRLSILALALLCGPAFAQEVPPDREALWREFEAWHRSKQAPQQPGSPEAQVPQRRGISELGQTTIFDNLFNPAISVIGDFVLAVSDQDDGFESVNQFVLRDVEIGFVGRVDPYVSYQVYIHFDEEDIEIEEAYALADDWLPWNFSLKAGRYNMDFGKLSPIHEHDLPFLDKPQVLQEYLGGSLRGTGVELHHNLGVGGTTLLRWSLGMVNSLDGDAHSIFGPAAGHEHDDEGPEPFGERELEDFAFSGRLSALLEIGSDATLQIGGSVAYAPEASQFFEDPSMNVIRAGLTSEIYGLDVTFKTLDPRTGRGLNAGVELLHTRNDVTGDGLTIDAVEANGWYGYAERVAGPNWSYGASGGWYEHAEDGTSESWDAGGFVTWRANEFNRLRVEARHFDDPLDETQGLAVQWTIILGSHGHTIDW